MLYSIQRQQNFERRKTMLSINNLKMWIKYRKKIVRTEGKNFSVILTKKEFEELTDFPSHVNVEGRFT